MSNIKKYICNDEVFEYTITSSSITNIPFRILIQNDIIYEGKMYKKPNSNLVSVNVSRICEQYLETLIPENISAFTGTLTYNHPKAYIAFKFETFDVTTNTWTLQNTYYFLNDWDSDTATGTTLPVSLNLNNPINGHAGTNMIRPKTDFSNTNSRVQSTFSRTSTTLYNSGWCGEYAIYYVNSKGGIDAFLFEGICTVQEDYDQSEYTKNYSIPSIQFGKNRYTTQTTTSWELNTHLLTKEEGAKFVKELCSSNCVYLHNLVTNKIVPVVIKDVTQKYKSFENEDYTPFFYTLNVESSQVKTRK